jgi:hypothetical protein
VATEVTRDRKFLDLVKKAARTVANINYTRRRRIDQFPSTLT